MKFVTGLARAISAQLRTLYDAAMDMSRKDGFEISGYIAYSAMFALFPFLIFLTSLGGLIGSAETTNQFIDYIVDYVPKDVADTLVPVVRQVTTGPRHGLLTIGLATTIWSAASGVDALRLALNRAYAMTEHRNYVLRKLQSFLFVVGGVVIIFLLSVLIILAPYLLQLIDFLYNQSGIGGLMGDTNPFERLRPLIQVGRYILGLVLLTGTLVLMHRWLPSQRIAWRDIIPGAIFTTSLWTLSATAFSYYIGKFSHYGATYGSLGGVIITLLFFYLTAAVFILGGEVNATVWRRKHPEMTMKRRTTDASVKS